MRLSKQEFTKGLSQIMYPGRDLAVLWNTLDRDQSGWVSFLHFATEDALALAHFKRWVDLNFGSAAALFKLLDTSRDGRLSFREFEQGLTKLGLQGHAKVCVKSLFDLIDDAGDEFSMRKITVDELAFLDRWECPEYMWVEPDFDAKESFLKSVIARYRSNPLLAWRKALDTDSSMRVSYYEFIDAFKKLSQKGIFPNSITRSAPGLFRALDGCKTGWLSLRDFDLGTYEQLKTFTAWTRAEFGKVSQCCKSLSGPDGNGLVHFKPFRRAVQDPLGLSQDEVRNLFEGLSLETKGEGTIKPDELFFLDRWDYDAEREEEEAWLRMVSEVEASLQLVDDDCRSVGADDS
jgi:Ca2+-binding EF-hand superfamily protein